MLVLMPSMMGPTGKGPNLTWHARQRRLQMDWVSNGFRPSAVEVHCSSPLHEICFFPRKIAKSAIHCNSFKNDREGNLTKTYTKTRSNRISKGSNVEVKES